MDGGDDCTEMVKMVKFDVSYDQRTNSKKRQRGNVKH
jgi:hypothetical protein